MATDKVPVARSASTTAYSATMAEIATWANTNLPVASTTVGGVVKVDGTSITIASGVISSASGAGVSTWNARAGSVVLQQSDITAVGALHDVGRNLLHNSMFNVAQRGAGPFTTNAAYTLDRWSMLLNTDTNSITQLVLTDADRAAIGDEAAVAGLQNVFVGNAAAGAFSFVLQRMEGVRRLAGKTVTVSFWARAAAGAPKLGINMMQYFGAGGSPSGSVWNTAVAVTLSTNWTRYTATFAVPSATAKTSGTSANDGTDLAFWYSAGATQSANAGSIGVQSGTIQLWGIQCEIGTQATPLEKPDPRYDLANCQRFYQVLVGVKLLTYCGGASAFGYSVPWPVTMRAAPTVAFSGTSYGNASGLTQDFATSTNLSVYATSTGAGSAYFQTNVTASADL